MKKISLLALAAFVAASVVGCSSSGEEEAAPTTPSNLKQDPKQAGSSTSPGGAGSVQPE